MTGCRIRLWSDQSSRRKIFFEFEKLIKWWKLSYKVIVINSKKPFGPHCYISHDSFNFTRTPTAIIEHFAWELPPNTVYKVYTKDTRTILNRFYALLSCFHYLLWISKFQLGRYSRLGNRYICFHCNFNCVKSIILGAFLSSITLSTCF